MLAIRRRAADAGACIASSVRARCPGRRRCRHSTTARPVGLPVIVTPPPWTTRPPDDSVIPSTGKGRCWRREKMTFVSCPSQLTLWFAAIVVGDGGVIERLDGGGRGLRPEELQVGERAAAAQLDERAGRGAQLDDGSTPAHPADGVAVRRCRTPWSFGVSGDRQGGFRVVVPVGSGSVEPRWPG